MAGLYELGVRDIMGAGVDLENASIYVMLVDTNSYTADLDSDNYYDDIPNAARIAEAVLVGKTLDGTTFRATDTTFVSVTTGQNVDAVVLFLNTDYEDTSTLIAYIDNAPEFPITTDGDDITIVWDTGANGIFKL